SNDGATGSPQTRSEHHLDRHHHDAFAPLRGPRVGLIHYATTTRRQPETGSNAGNQTLAGACVPRGPGVLRIGWRHGGLDDCRMAPLDDSPITLRARGLCEVAVG